MWNLYACYYCDYNLIFQTLYEKGKKTALKQTQLQETDFAEFDLTGSFFDWYDLERTRFEHTHVENADFS
ncbi:MAG: pentapeptide repeat-containing protein [Bacteroidales bacterium]|nr:pentapeptide repeat-containing protein [Bacteroidales bacterium]